MKLWGGRYDVETVLLGCICILSEIVDQRLWKEDHNA